MKDQKKAQSPSPVRRLARMTQTTGSNPLQEEQAFVQQYLRLADTILRNDEASPAGGTVMGNPNLQVVRYEPLTLGCSKCLQRFIASDKSLQQVEDEIADHFRLKHPEVMGSESQPEAA